MRVKVSGKVVTVGDPSISTEGIIAVVVKEFRDSCSTCAFYKRECQGNWFGWCNRFKREAEEFTEEHGRG